MLKKILKTTAVVLLVILILMQFYPRPAKNLTGIKGENFIGNNFTITDSAEKLLAIACYDCHSNQTAYPWYTSIQPVAMYLNDHVIDGKKKLNFSTFTSYNLAKQFHKLEEVEEMITDDEMPLTSYSLIHRDASLSSNEKQLLINWSRDLRSQMKAKYPADSLIRKKK